MHVTPLHGEPGPDQGDTGQVCREGRHLPHSLHSGWVEIIMIQSLHSHDPEAHPTESGDYIDYFLPINKHQTLEDRLSAASKKFTFTWKIISSFHPECDRWADQSGDSPGPAAGGQHEQWGIQSIWLISWPSLHCTGWQDCLHGLYFEWKLKML